MKKSYLAEIKKADQKTIDSRIAKISHGIVSLVLDKNTGKLANEQGSSSNKKEIKNKRRDLAQMLTVQRQKEILADLEGNQKKEEING